MKPRRLASAAALLALTPAAVQAQGRLWAWPYAGSLPGASAAGDIDGDGLDDFLVGAPTDDELPGRAFVYSGRTGDQLVLVVGASPHDGFGSHLVALGDVDLDGRPDFAVSAPSLLFAGYVRVFSGATGVVLWQRYETAVPVSFGGSLARLSDLDGDGADELVVGSRAATVGAIGEVYVLSGASGAVLHHFAGVAGASQGFGACVASAGDVDLDGKADVLVGDSDPQSGAGRVTIHSGANGSILRAIVGPVASSGFGEALASVGDVSGDGVPDVAVSSITETVVPLQSWGRVRLYSGADGALLLQLQGGVDLTYFGETVQRFPDRDGDGRSDLLVGAGAHHMGCCAFTPADLRVYSSASGALLLRDLAQSSSGVTSVPDANGDGVEDLLVPFGLLGTALVTSVVLVNVRQPEFVVTCIAKLTSQGCRPQIEWRGAPSPTIGDDFSIAATGVTPSSFGLFVWSRNAAQTPFGGGSLCVAAPIRRWPASGTSAGQRNPQCPSVDSGAMTLWLSKPALAAMGLLPGDVFHVQGYFRDRGFAPPNDVGLTDSLAVTMWL